MALLDKSSSAILDMCTGSGKTVCIAEIARRFQPRKTLILAHRRELVRQAKDKVEGFAGLNVSVEMAGERASRSLFRDYDVVVSSVQSQTPGRRMKPEEFDLLVIDEFHHAKPKNKSYMDVINHYRQNPNLKILGVTATLEKPCLNVIPEVAYSYPLLKAIDDGYLVEPKQQMVHIEGLDYSHIKTTAGDLNMGELSAILEAEEVSQRMIQATLESMFSLPPHSLSEKPIENWGDYLFNFKPKRNLVFTVSVAQARTMSEIFNRVMPNKWAFVCADKNLISEDRRKEIDTDFQSGKLLGVCNCGIYSEGYDNVYIDMVTMARPTKSPTLYKQQVGRLTRVLPGVIDGVEFVDGRLMAIAASAKPTGLVLDFVGNSGRHKLCSIVDIVAEDFEEEVIVRAKKKAEKSGAPESMTEALEEAARQLAEEKRAREQEEAARKAHLVAKAQYRLTSVNPFDRYDLTPRKANSWDDKHPLSEKQTKVLTDSGIDVNGMSHTHRKQLFRKVVTLPSPKQAKCLTRAGYDVSKMSREQASKIMTVLVANGWDKNATDAVLGRQPDKRSALEKVIDKIIQPQFEI